MNRRLTRAAASAGYPPVLATRGPGRVRLSLAVLLVAGLLVPLTTLAHPPGVTERVSVASDGSEGNDASPWLSPAAISADGRFVAFDSAATNLIPGGSLLIQLYVHDRLTDTTQPVSVSSSGRFGDQGGSSPALSADGRFVAFDSDSTNLVSGDRNDITDVFRHDRLTGETIRVSVSSDGQEGDASSHAPAISADGRIVVFHANSSLAPEDTNETTDVYVYDTVTGTTELVSVAFDGSAGDNTSFIQDISADGRFVAFVSDASNLVPNDTTPFDAEVYVRDRVLGTTEMVSVGSDETQASVGFFDSPSISADGRYVAFATFESLDPADTLPFSLDIYLRDRTNGTTELISVNSAEAQADGRNSHPDVSADGRFVAFTSEAMNLAPEQSSIFPDEDIFIRDRQAGTTVRVSESSTGDEGNARSLGPALSANGLVVAFSSDASNLVPADTNGATDVFVHDERPAADLAVSITETLDPVRKGETLTYSVTVTNTGPGAATGVELTNQLTANVRVHSVTSSSGSCAVADGTVTCALGDLGNGASSTVTIVVSSKKVGTISITARTSSLAPDPNAADNTASEETTVVR